MYKGKLKCFPVHKSRRPNITTLNTFRLPNRELKLYNSARLTFIDSKFYKFGNLWILTESYIALNQLILTANFLKLGIYGYLVNLIKSVSIDSSKFL